MLVVMDSCDGFALSLVGRLLVKYYEEWSEREVPTVNVRVGRLFVAVQVAPLSMDDMVGGSGKNQKDFELVRTRNSKMVVVVVARIVCGLWTRG